MSKGTVLIEGHNLTLATGTGIATYARALGATVRGLGYTTDVLLGTARKLDARDRLLSEVSFYDARAASQGGLARALSLAPRAILGAPLGLKAMTLELGAAVVPPSDRLGGFRRINAVRDLDEAARLHFMRYGARAIVKVGETPKLFHATQTMPVRVHGCPNIYTIHDLVPLRLPYATLDHKRYFLKLVRHLAATADHIVTVSEHSRRDIIELIGVPEHRITNTYQSVHLPEAALATPMQEVAAELAHAFDLEPGGYFLFVGAIEPKKNLVGLIDAFAAAGSRRPLIIVGGHAWQAERELQMIGDERFLRYRVIDGTITPRRRVRRLQYLPLAQLIALMRGARGMLFPSLYEGFGLPVLEAMVAGTPVLTSTAASLPEIAGDAALLVDPTSVAAIAAGIRQLDQDDGLCADLVRRGRERAKEFSPERYRQRVAELYGRFIG